MLLYLVLAELSVKYYKLLYLQSHNNNTEALRECRPPLRYEIISKWVNLDFFNPDGDPDRSQNLKGS